MKSILIKDTTSIERIQIVKDALEGEYDDFMTIMSPERKNSPKSTGSIVSSMQEPEQKIDCDDSFQKIHSCLFSLK